MSLNSHLERWTGDVFRHLPAGKRFDVLDFRYAGRSAENRWNEPGQPTLYLAGDEGVLIVEWGRHFAVNRTDQLRQETVERTVYSLSISLENVIDLTQKYVWDELSLADAPRCFMDIRIARATANFIRATTDAHAMVVPSMGFLDQMDRWCLVIFLDKLPDPKTFVSEVTECGPLRWA